MKRFIRSILTLIAISLPSHVVAQAVAPSGWDSQWVWGPVYMRNTTAANTVARQLDWAKGSPGGQVTPGFSDSTVFRRAVGTLTVYDTTQAFQVQDLPFPTILGTKGGSTALADTAAINPWIGLRVRQDTTAYGYTSVSALDSVHVGAQWSIDGINWNAVNGTPTVQPSNAFFTSGEDGVAPLGIKGAELSSPGSDLVEFILTCNRKAWSEDPGAALIINKTLCEAPGYIRFIIGMDGTGQFAVDMAKWRNR